MCLCLYFNSSLRHKCRKQPSHFCFKFVSSCCFICPVLRFFLPNGLVVIYITLCLLYLVLQYWRRKYTKNGTNMEILSYPLPTLTLSMEILNFHLFVIGLRGSCGSCKFGFSLLLMICCCV